MSHSERKACRTEVLTVFALLFLMLVGSALTRNIWPAVWTDDLIWSEPAINLARTGHFTTMVSQLEPADTFYCTQSPLYPLALTVWIWIFGQSLSAIRSFNLFLMTVATVLLWLLLLRSGLVRNWICRVAAVPLLWLGAGVAFAYRCSRPDITGMICLLVLAHAYLLRNCSGRVTLIFLAAFLTPWVGVQVGLYAVWVSFLGFSIFRRIRLWEFVTTCAGVGTGMASMVALFLMHGCLSYFFGSLSQAAHERTFWSNHTSYVDSILPRLTVAAEAYVSDFSAVPLLAVVFWLLVRAHRCMNPGLRSPLCFLVSIFVSVPVLFSMTGHFAYYYSYLIFVPLLMAFLSLWSESPSKVDPNREQAETGFKNSLVHRPYSGLVAICPIFAFASLIVGLPLTLVLSALAYAPAPRSEFNHTIASCLQPSDVVFSDYPAFFEAKAISDRVFAPIYSKAFVELSPRSHDFSPAEKRSINVMIVKPEALPQLQNYFGGKWTAASKPFGDRVRPFARTLASIPFIGRRIAARLRNPQTDRFLLQVFRRQAEA